MAGSGPGSLGEEAPLSWQGPEVAWPLREQDCSNLGKLLACTFFLWLVQHDWVWQTGALAALWGRRGPSPLVSHRHPTLVTHLLA